MITFTCRIKQVDQGHVAIDFSAPPSDATAAERVYYDKMLAALKVVIMGSSKNAVQVEIDPPKKTR